MTEKISFVLFFKMKSQVLPSLKKRDHQRHESQDAGIMVTPLVFFYLRDKEINFHGGRDNKEQLLYSIGSKTFRMFQDRILTIKLQYFSNVFHNT